jgi:hypothetical protein
MFGDSHLFSGASIGALSKPPTPLNESNQPLRLRLWWGSRLPRPLAAQSLAGAHGPVLASLGVPFTRQLERIEQRIADQPEPEYSGGGSGSFRSKLDNLRDGRGDSEAAIRDVFDALLDE